MTTLDPYTEIIFHLVEVLADITGMERSKIAWLIRPPSRREYGDLSIPIIRFSKKINISPRELATIVMKRVSERELPLKSWKIEKGYLNMLLNIPRIVEMLSNLYESGWRISVPKTQSPLRIVVEHTSANPIHPLHTGHARNTSIGDTLSRMLKARGHIVNSRYYVDDVGKQVAVVAYGFEILGVDPLEEAKKLKMKPDHFAGWVYASTHSLIDFFEAKEKLAKITSDEDRRRVQAEIDDLIGVIAELRNKDPGNYFNKLLDNISRGKAIERVREIMLRYEKGLEPEKSLVRRVASAVLEGIRETLTRIGVEFDAWDWESDIVWSSRVKRIIEQARRTPYYTTSKGAEAFNIPRIIKEILLKDQEARSSIKLPRGFEIPPLILVRSDGTTLYTTRDIAYTLYKFEVFKADKVINVIGADQRLAQLQLRLALLGLGFRREAVNLLHYDYEIVSLPGVKMSSRKGRFVDLDSILESLKVRAFEEVKKRNPSAITEWIEETAEKIAVGAARFTLVRTNAKRPLVFDISRALDLEENSGPYLQYTYARAIGILEKHGPVLYSNISYDSCDEEKRRGLLLEALRYPLVAAKAADDLAPEDLAVYLLRLADSFNSWYQVDTVIHERDLGKRECKALLVEVIADVLEHGLNLLGVPPLRRM